MTSRESVLEKLLIVSNEQTKRVETENVMLLEALERIMKDAEQFEVRETARVAITLVTKKK